MHILAFSIMERFHEYMRFYRRYASDAWDNMTPMQYGSLLIGIGVFGYLLMRTSLTKS